MLTLANPLSDGTTITGVIDINPPVLAGDRAFDLATFRCQVHGQRRSEASAAPSRMASNLAHMTLGSISGR